MPTIPKITSSDTFSMFKIPDLRQCNSASNNKLTSKEKSKITLCAFIGATLPVVAYNSLKKGRIDEIANSFQNKLPFKDKFKSIWKLFEIENYPQILLTAAGGVSGGLLGGLKYAKTKEDKEAKYKESIFEFLNIMVPTTLVAGGLKLLKRFGKSKSIPYQAGIILSSVAGGMFIANKASNKINELGFDKNKKKEDRDIRNFKITDCLVHVDDLVKLAVLTRIPLASKLQVDKLLPILFARSGYEAGTATKKNKAS